MKSKEAVVRSMKCPKRQCGSSSTRCNAPLRVVPGRIRSRLFCDEEECGFRLTVRNELLEAEAERKAHAEGLKTSLTQV